MSRKYNYKLKRNWHSKKIRNKRKDFMKSIHRHFGDKFAETKFIEITKDALNREIHRSKVSIIHDEHLTYPCYTCDYPLEFAHNENYIIQKLPKDSFMRILHHVKYSYQEKYMSSIIHITLYGFSVKMRVNDLLDENITNHFDLCRASLELYDEDIYTDKLLTKIAKELLDYYKVNRKLYNTSLYVFTDSLDKIYKLIPYIDLTIKYIDECNLYSKTYRETEGRSNLQKDVHNYMKNLNSLLREYPYEDILEVNESKLSSLASELLDSNVITQSEKQNKDPYFKEDWVY